MQFSELYFVVSPILYRLLTLYKIFPNVVMDVPMDILIAGSFLVSEVPILNFQKALVSDGSTGYFWFIVGHS